MKIFRTLFLSIALLFVCLGGGVIAADTVTVSKPTAAVDPTAPNGQITGLTLQDIPTSGTDGKNTLSTEEGKNWYWAGQTITPGGDEELGKAGTLGKYEAAIVTDPLGFEDNASGTVNIVVGPNGTSGVPAMVVSGGFEIPDGVTVKIYRAVNGLTVGDNTNAPIADQNCFLQINATTPTPEGSTNSAIIVAEKGNLQVISGAICGQNNETGTGISISGTVTVSPEGELQGNTAGTNVTDPGITVNSGGSLQANGGSIYSLQSQADYGYGRAISGNVTMAGGTVYASNALSNTQAGYGVWMTTGNTVGANGRIGTLTGTAFNNTGNNTIQNITLTSNGYYISFGANESLTINNNVNLTLPPNYLAQPANYGVEGNPTPGLNFTSAALTGSQKGPNLTINTGGTFTIPSSVDVTMGANSTLTNSGTINVESAEN